jgi:hypothetical protein
MKSRKRPGARRYRPISPVTLTAFSRGIRHVPGLDYQATSAALNAALSRMASLGMVSELETISRITTFRDIETWLDICTALTSEDTRWQSWRDFRRTELSYAN